MRWRNLVGGLALVLAVIAGCKQQIFLTEPDYNHYQELASANLDNNPAAGSIVPDVSAMMIPTPTTVDHPERPIKYICLREAIAVALEQGYVGAPLSGFGFGLSGIASDATVSGPIPRGFNGALDRDSIRVLALDPATYAADIETALSKFDTRLISSMTWNTTDVPIATALQVFQAGGQNLNSIQTEAAAFSTGLLKPLPTGGVAGITFNTNYTYTNLPNPVNPAYQPVLQFQFEQPLLQGFGTEINQLTSQHPNSILTPFSPVGQTVEGILVTRVRYDQARADFERGVAQQLLNVEIAYWNLYQSYGVLMARELALRINYEVWKIVNAKYQAGTATAADLNQARGQYEFARGQRLAALGSLPGQQSVLEAERQLRRLLGMPIEDGFRLVPSDDPVLTPYHPDWKTALEEGLMLKPELAIVREQLKADQMNVMLWKNQLMPDLRIFATYDTNALGDRLDGPTANNALSQLASNHYNDWQVGLRLNMPIGFRAAHAAVRKARLQLAQSYWALYSEEQKVQGFLAAQYRNLFATYNQIAIQRSQREAYSRQVAALLQEIIAGRKTYENINLLQAIRFGSDAMAQEYINIGAYNQALASFEWAKGTMLIHDNVVLGEGPLPGAAHVRAVDHIRERQSAIRTRQRANPGPAPQGPGFRVPLDANLPSLPTTLGDELKAPDLPETLPAPNPLPGGNPTGSTPNMTPPINSPAISGLPAAPVSSVTPPAPIPLGNSGGFPLLPPSVTGDSQK